MSYSISAIDLDETLLGSDGAISAHSLHVLRRWQEDDRQVVIATGRPYRSVGRSLPEELRHLPLICYNGAEIHLDGAKVYENFIPVDATRQIVADLLGVAVDAHIGVEVGGELYLNRPMNRPSPYHLAEDLLAVAVQPAAKILIFADALDAFHPLFADLPTSSRVLLTPKYRFAQILAATADKAEALRVLLARWQRPLASVVAFGDDTNDVEMVRVSGLGVAMANAVDAVKAVADHITTGHDEEGVALVLETLLAGVDIAIDGRADRLDPAEVQ